MDIPPNTQTDLQPDWARLLPREAFQEIILVLRGALPPPVTDAPADEVRRDRAAMAGVAALQPANAAEGRLAAQFVAADAWAMDCLRLAQERRLEMDIARKCRAQAMGMMREAKSSLRLLMRLQAMRQKLATDEVAAAQAAWAEHGAAGMMAEALAAVPVAPVASPPPASRKASPARRPAGTSGSVAKNATNSRESRTETDARFRSPVQAAVRRSG